MSKIFYEILDEKRLTLLPLFKYFKKDFYLAGGTGLALQIGHRDSIDFDFFTAKEFDTKKLFQELKSAFKNHKLLKIQEEKNTLSLLINKEVRCSFFSYDYPLCKEPINEKCIKIASIEDIACMKLSAITGRASNKDYIDLYFVLNKIPLKNILAIANTKFPDLDLNLILKSLAYFEDIKMEPILFKKNHEVKFETVKISLVKSVQKLKPY